MLRDRKFIRDHGSRLATDRLVGYVRDNGSVQGYRDDGVVLRTQKLGEADRIITLLTRHNGRVRAVAKGVRRTKSRFGARLEPFTHVDVMIHPGRSLDVITQAEVIRAYGTPLVTDYPRYTAGTAMLETAERLTPVEKEPAIRQFLLLIGGLRTLGEAGATQASGPPAAPGDPAAEEAAGPRGVRDPIGGEGEEARSEAVAGGAHGPGNLDGSETGAGTPPPLTVPRDPRLVLDAYFLRSLTFAGYAPALQECARCGAPGTATAAAASTDSSPGADGSPRNGGNPSPGSPGTGSRGPAGHPNGTKPLVGFSVAAGGMVCAGCRPPGSASPAPQTVALMLALLRGDWAEAMRTERRHRVECSGLVAAYLQWHLEHSIRSLRHVERA